jgi:hemin uptake protein HemP
MSRAAAPSTAVAPAAATPPPPSSPTPEALPPIVSSQTVLQGRAQVAIEHNGAVYRLQTTRQGKLILTK